MEGFVRHYLTILTHILPCPCTGILPAGQAFFYDNEIKNYMETSKQKKPLCFF